MIEILHLTHSQIDKDKWDTAVNKSHNTLIYVYSWYLDIVSPQWDALITPDYSYIFPLTHKNKMGISYLCQPPFTQQLGLFSHKEISESIVIQFLEKIPSKYNLIEIFLNSSNTQNTYKTYENITFELELNDDFENIRHKYSQNTERNIKKGESQSLYIKPLLDIDSGIALFKKNKGKHIKTLKSKDYNILKDLLWKVQQKQLGEFWGAYNNNNALCAAAYFLLSHKKAIFIFSAINTEGKEKRAMFLLINHFIKNNVGKISVLDFEGSNEVNLARFYIGFGAKKNTYFLYTLNKLSYFVKLFKNIKNKF